MTTYVAKVSEGAPLQRIAADGQWHRLRSARDGEVVSLFPMPEGLPIGSRVQLEYQLGWDPKNLPLSFTVAWFRETGREDDQTGGNDYDFTVRGRKRGRVTAQHTITITAAFKAVYLAARVYAGPLLVDTRIVKVEPQ